MRFIKPIIFTEAAEKIGVKSPIGSKLLSSEWRDVPVALRERAMFSSGVENVRFLQRSQDAIGDYLAATKETLPNGQVALKVGGRAQFIDMMREFALKEGMGPLDPADAGGLKDITSERRLGLIFDTLTRQGGDYGYWRQGMDPDVLYEFPAQRFIRVLDVKEPRNVHIPHEDQIYLKTDPIWARQINRDFGVPWGPWGWGCGHDVEDVDRDEAIDAGVLKPGQPVQPDVKNFNENLQASTRGLAPELLEKLKNAFGEQLQIQGETMKWIASPASNPKPAAPAPAPGSPAAAPRPQPSPTPVAAPAPAVPQRTSPVSKAFDVNVTGQLREQVNTAFAAIDKIHDDGDLPDTPLMRSTKRSYGFMQPKMGPTGVTVDYVGISATGPWPALTSVHEVGHVLDLEVIGTKGWYATRGGDAIMKDVLAAAEQTKQIQTLRRLQSNSNTYRSREKFNYLLDPAEIWARAYAQFITERSGNMTLLRDLDRSRSQESLKQWSTEDFKPIATEIEKMFRKLGWL